MDSLVVEAAVLGDELIVRERATILGDVERQRTETFESLDELIATARADAVADVDAVVDDAIRRLGLLVAGLGLGLFVGLAVLVLLYNRTRPETRAV